MAQWCLCYSSCFCESLALWYSVLICHLPDICSSITTCVAGNRLMNVGFFSLVRVRLKFASRHYADALYFVSKINISLKVRCAVEIQPTGDHSDNLKMTAFRYTVLYSLIEVAWHYRCAYCLHYQGLFITLAMVTVHTSKTSVCINKIKWRYIPEGCHLHTCCCENLKSQPVTTCCTVCML
jgi:hypothetical protein